MKMRSAKSLLVVLWIAAIAPHAMAADPRAPAASTGTTRIWMRNLLLFPYPDVPTSVSELNGMVRPTHQDRPVILDDVTSYSILVDHGAVQLTANDITILMNKHLLPIGNGPIKHVDVTLNDGSISMSGTMVKLGIPVPFTATAVLAPTQNGDMRVHMTEMRAGEVIPKSIMDALGMQLSNIAQPANPRAFHIEGDDLIVPLVSMFPPPVFTGRLSAVRVTPARIFVTIGQGGSEPPPVQSRSYLSLQGGTVLFAKLTMRDTDIVILPIDPQKDLGFSPVHYYQQMVGGEVIPQPDLGLVARVKDFRDLHTKP